MDLVERLRAEARGCVVGAEDAKETDDPSLAAGLENLGELFDEAADSLERAQWIALMIAAFVFVSGIVTGLGVGWVVGC